MVKRTSAQVTASKGCGIQSQPDSPSRAPTGRKEDHRSPRPAKLPPLPSSGRHPSPPPSPIFQPAPGVRKCGGPYLVVHDTWEPATRAVGGGGAREGGGDIDIKSAATISRVVGELRASVRGCRRSGDASVFDLIILHVQSVKTPYDRKLEEGKFEMLLLNESFSPRRTLLSVNV
ncbi:hypothetical protein J6590_069281 [Homalodisca vitripennis]|nr:hypothetical protein J6590_095659 [Homalodisca vitripennis]KAG8320415.1 hypothetical protein J6590_069276 [Homalodisca vitripennis]KAG8320420.1 hypothetical protein J6590_069281 [Homalodisca vitripennis]